MDHLNNGILLETICFAGLWIYTIVGWREFLFWSAAAARIWFELIYNLLAVKFTKGCMLIGV